MRTFPLFSAAGYLLTLVADAAGDGRGIIIGAGILGMIAIAIAFLWVRHQLGITGLTTPMAMLVTFFIGLLIGGGLLQEAIVVSVATTLLLLTKDRLHKFAEILDDEEIMGALQFITVVFILFPLVRVLRPPVLGQDWIGRGALLDPYFTLLIVIFVSSISFASFVAMRVVGARRGVAVSGLLGGLVSSEATTISLAGYATGHKPFVRVAVTGILLATTTMFVRNLAIAGFADPTLRVVRDMLPALAIMTIVAGAFATWRYQRQRGAERKEGEMRLPRVKNPFALGPAVKFALLFLGLKVAGSLAQEALGPVGVYATALGGIVSAGAVVASVTSLYATGAVSLDVAVVTGVLATILAAANKLVILRTANLDVFTKAKVPLGIVVIVGLVGLVAVMLV